MSNNKIHKKEIVLNNEFQKKVEGKMENAVGVERWVLSNNYDWKPVAKNLPKKEGGFERKPRFVDFASIYIQNLF